MISIDKIIIVAEKIAKSKDISLQKLKEQIIYSMDNQQDEIYGVQDINASAEQIVNAIIRNLILEMLNKSKDNMMNLSDMQSFIQSNFPDLTKEKFDEIINKMKSKNFISLTGKDNNVLSILKNCPKYTLF